MKSVEEYIKLAKDSNDALDVIENALDDPDLSDDDIMKLIGVLQYLKAGVSKGREMFGEDYLGESMDFEKVYQKSLRESKPQRMRDVEARIRVMDPNCLLPPSLMYREGDWIELGDDDYEFTGNILDFANLIKEGDLFGDDDDYEGFQESTKEIMSKIARAQVGDIVSIYGKRMDSVQCEILETTSLGKFRTRK